MNSSDTRQALQRLMGMCTHPSKCTGKSQYFTDVEVKEAFKRFGCNTTSNFGGLLDIVVEENFMGKTSNSLRKDSIGMIEYLETVYNIKNCK